MFDLEKEIKNWLRNLRKNPGFEDGDIEEIEDHVRDSIEHHIDIGFTEEEAFRKSIVSFGEIKNTGIEMLKSRTKEMKIPKTSILQNNYSSSSNSFKSSTILFNNYIKSSVRNLIMNKYYSLISIFGLSVGFAAFTLIAIFVHHELSYDQYNKDFDRIYRIVRDEYTCSPPAMAPKLKADIPEINFASRYILQKDLLTIEWNRHSNNMKNLCYLQN